MKSFIAGPLLIFSFCVLILGMIFMSRKPVCIASRVVERIDRGGESVFRCSFNHHIPFSPYFNEKLPGIEARVQEIESFTERIEPFKSNIHLEIIPDKPNYFVVKGNTISMGEAMLNTRGHLEKALLKVWYRESARNLFAYENLFEEVYTDFLLYLAKGSVKIDDPFRGLRTKVNGSYWPQVLKSVQSYCQSPWKISEHYRFCDQLKSQDMTFADQVLELSVRPLLVSSWIESYKSLSFRDQYYFVKNLKVLLSEDHNPDLPLVKTGGILPQGAPLQEASEAIKNISHFLVSSELMKNSDSHRIFVTLVANNLSRFGYSDNFAGAYFDLLILSDSKVNAKSAQFKHYLEVSKLNPKSKIAVKDGENLWMLPSVYPIRWKSVQGIKATRAIYSKCGTYNFGLIWQFANVTDKLLVLNICKEKTINLTDYMKDGLEGFGAQNKDIPFIQFHIPSLLMRKDQLAEVSNVPDLLVRREVDNPGFRSLGWQAIQWNERAGAYQPKAYVDGIEWFRQ
jgi:hypothetical protein